MEKLKPGNLTVVTLFFLTALFFLASALMGTGPVYPGNEAGEATAFPEFSTDAFLGGDWAAEVESALAARINTGGFWEKLKTDMDYLLGKREFGGVYIGENALLKRLDEPDERAVRQNIRGLMDFFSRHSQPCYVMLVPTVSEVFPEELPPYASAWSQKQLLDRCYEELSATSVWLDVYKALVGRGSEVIYYRTDPHWTMLGAYYAYQEAAGRLNFVPKGLGDLDVETLVGEYYGELYHSAGRPAIRPDRLNLYHFGRDDQVNLVEIYTAAGVARHDSIYFRDYADSADAYQVFLGESRPMAKIHTTVKGRPSLLVFGDSYADSLIPFLALHYSRITIVDLSQLEVPYLEWVDPAEYDQVLFVYGIEAFSQSDALSALSQT